MNIGSNWSRRLTGTGRKPRSLLPASETSIRRRWARSALFMSVAFIACLPAGVDAGPGETLGGGSDIRGGSVVELTSGATVGPIHHVFADNPGTEPIEVQFHADAAPGIEITPELDHLTIQPGASTKDFFSIVLDPAVPPGDHTVTVQLVRSDIDAQPGQVTNIPAVGTSFTIRVTGASAIVTVEGTSIESGSPIDGTLVLAALTGTGTTFEIGRHEGSTFTHTVAPGRYRASFALDGRELASREADVGVDESVTIRLDVNTVSFVLVAAQPVDEDGRAVVANLTASVDNHLAPIAGNVTIHALVYRAGRQIDTATLFQSDQLAIGITEATLVYRPQSGFEHGDYRFEFELVTEEFTLRSLTQPTFTVAEPSSSNAAFYVALAAGTALIGAISAVTVFVGRTYARRRRAGRRLTSADTTPGPVRPAATSRPSPPPLPPRTPPPAKSWPAPPRTLAPPDPEALSTAAKRHSAMR